MQVSRVRAGPRLMMSPRGMRFNRMETMATKVYHRKVPEEGLYGAYNGYIV